MPSSAGKEYRQESGRMTNESDEWRPDQYPNTAIFPLGLDCSLQATFNIDGVVVRHGNYATDRHYLGYLQRDHSPFFFHGFKVIHI